MTDEKPERRAFLLVDGLSEEPSAKAARGGDGGEPDLRPIQYSDDALAKRLSERLGADWRATPDGQWWQFDGKRFGADRLRAIYEMGRRVCREAGHECKNENLARRLSSKSTIYAAVQIAATDAAHATLHEDFDSNDWLLNTPTCVINLHSGQPRMHDRNLLMARMTKASPEGDAPQFHAFLRQATGADLDLQRFLQRAAGYCLTGSIEEHAMFFIEGPGGTGKSVFLNVVLEMMGDYATTAPMDTFTVASGERHPADLAMLAGARLVTASETEEGRRWDEAKLKQITGGDPITARHIRQDFFTFRPKFKLFMAGNYRPAMRSADDAMRRRFHVIPFKHRPLVPDKALPEKLRAEIGGILKWAVEGAAMWQRQGLAPPRIVVAATDEYFETENALGRWIEERCIRGAEETALTKELYRDFKSWAATTGEYVGTERRFAQQLVRAGFERWQKPLTRERGFRGIAPLHQQAPLGGMVGGGETRSPALPEWRTDPADEYDR